MNEEELDKALPKLTQLEIVIVIDACTKAGVVEAAFALSRHITRLQTEIALLKNEVEHEGMR